MQDFKSKKGGQMHKNKFGLWMAVVAFACVTAYGGDSPTKGVGHSSKAAVKSTKSASQWKAEYDRNLSLTAAMQKALNEYAPGFVAWKQGDYPPKRIAYYPYSAVSLPYAVKGDFNGDGIDDMALSGHDNDANITVALISSGTVYHAEPILVGKYYADARKYGKTVPYTPTVVLIRKEKGQVFTYGDMVEYTVKLQNCAVVLKGINWYAGFNDHIFNGRGGGFPLYEFSAEQGRFVQYPLEEIGDNIYSPFDEKF